MIDTNELRRLAQAALAVPDGLSAEWMDRLGQFQEAADASVVSELLDRLEEAESDALEQARLNGMGASREASLMAKLEEAEKERDALRAKIEAMEKQEPYSYIYEYSNPIDGSPVWRDKPGYWNAQFPKSSKPLYLAPGAQPAAPSFADAYQGAMEEVAIWKRRALEAEDLNRKFVAEINGPAYMGEPAQPAPSLPEGWLRAIDEALVVAHIGVANANDTYEQAKAKLDNLIGLHVDVATDPAVNGGWKLVPLEPTYEMLEAGEGALVPTYTDTPVSVPFDVYRAMLAAAPEAKP